MKIGGTTYVLTGNQNNFAPAAIHEEELSYDGANIRLVVDGKLVAVQAATGTVTQRPDENMVLGGIGAGNQSNSVASSAPWLGWLDSVQLSNTARSTCAGSVTLGASCYTAATAKFAGDSNTIFLTNFDQTLNPSGVLNSATQPGALIAADYTNGSGSGLAWMVLRNYALQIGIEQDFRDLGLVSSTFGIFDAVGTLSTFANINSNTGGAGIYLYGEAFGSHIENWIGAANGFNIAPFVEVGAAGLTDLENVHLTCGYYCVIGQDYLYMNHVFLQIPVQTLYGLVLQGGAVVTDLEVDAENCGGSNLTTAALVVGSTETRFIGSARWNHGFGRRQPAFVYQHIAGMVEWFRSASADQMDRAKHQRPADRQRDHDDSPLEPAKSGARRVGRDQGNQRPRLWRQVRQRD